MSTNLEYREGEKQKKKKREKRAGQRSSTRKGVRAREKNQRETFFVGITTLNFVAAGC